MEYKIMFTTEKEKQDIINQYKTLTYLGTSRFGDCSYIVFTDEEIVYRLTETEILGNKISILEEENAQMQYALMMIGAI